MGRKIRLVVSIDTEEDNWDSVRTGLSTENIRELPRLARFLERVGVRPTYFVNYQVAHRPWAVGIVRDVASAGSGEIATHLHPWNTPPVDDAVRGAGTMLCNYALEAQAAKIKTVTDAIAEGAGRRPISFRAGRFGLGPETVLALIDNGYRIDSSVTPLFSWAGADHGPDFTSAPPNIYRLDGHGDVSVPVSEGSITEVPISGGFTRLAPSHWPAIEKLLRQPAVRTARLPGIAARTRLFKKVLLSPENTSVWEMMALSRLLVEAEASHLHLYLHSSSLRPGLTPFVTSRADLSHLYEKLERYLERLSALGTVMSTTVDEAAASAAQAAAVTTSEPDGRSSAALAAVPSAPERPRRLLVINYHFPPDGSVGGLRWAGLTKHLARLGWEVHVLTGAPAAGGVRDGFQVHVAPRSTTLNDLYKSVATRVRSRMHLSEIYAPGMPDWRPSGAIAALRLELASLLAFPDESRGWMHSAALAARRLMRRFRPDIVVTSGPPHSAHLAGIVAVSGSNVPLVADLRDPWSNQSEPWRNDPVIGTRTAQMLIPRLEQMVFRVARQVIVNTSEMAEALESRHPALRVRYVRNGVDLERLPTGEVERFPGLHIAYAGTLYGDRVMEPVLRALRLYLDRHPGIGVDQARLRIAGHMEPDRRVSLDRSIEALSLAAHVDVLGLIPAERALDLVRRSGISVVLAQNQSLQVPAKLYESLGLGVVTLVIAESDSATAQESRLLGGLNCEATDVERICRYFEDVALGTLRAGPRQLSSFDFAHLAGAVAEILGEEIDGGTRSGGAWGPGPLPGPGLALQGEPQANWLWLSDTPTGGALEIRMGNSALATSLGLFFHPVESLDLTPGPVSGLPYGDASFACVALNGGLGQFAGSSRALLEECRRVLVPGGCLYLAGRNPAYRRVFSIAHSFSATAGRAAIARSLRAAGFSSIRSYYASPSHDAPRSILPATRHAASAHERFEARSSASMLLRLGLARAGWHDALYPSLLVLAHR